MLTVYADDLMDGADESAVLAAVPANRELGLYAWKNDEDDEDDEDEEHTYVGTLREIETVWDEESRALWCCVLYAACGGRLSRLAELLAAEGYEIEYIRQGKPIY